MSKSPQEIFEDLLSEAEKDPHVIGFFLGGSRGKGYENEFSDYDVKLIVSDDAIEEYQKKFDEELPEIDLVVSSLSEFKEYAEWQSDTHWDRYDHTHVRALVDKTGEIQTLIDDKGSIPPQEKKEYVHQEIDAYINHFFRSVKSHRRKDTVGAQLAAAVSIPHALNILFTLHNRATPFNDYLTRELHHRPLEKFSLHTEQLLDTIVNIISSGDLQTQQTFASMIKTFARTEGFGKAFDDWEGKDRWAMEFSDETS